MKTFNLRSPGMGRKQIRGFGLVLSLALPVVAGTNTLFRGRVLDAAGAPVSAWVGCGENGDSAGRFSLAVNSDDTCRLKIRHENFDTLLAGAIAMDSVLDGRDLRLPVADSQAVTSAPIDSSPPPRWTGRILNEEDSTPLAGTWVRCRDQSDSVLTTADGRFQLNVDSVDSCRLLVRRQGFADLRSSPRPPGAESDWGDIRLYPATEIRKSKMVVVVYGLSGQGRALNQQKNSDNLKNVVSAELIAALPDHSTADALQRVPGLSIERDQGEGRYVQIRGTEANLSTVTINGQSISGPDAKTRAVSLDVIPADQLAEIEVSKVLTPEMDADAIGGTINLKTATATSDFWKDSFTGLTGFAQLSDEPSWQGSATVGRRFQDGKLGFFAGASYYKDQTETQNFEMGWDTSSYNTAGIGLSQPLNLEFRDYALTNERMGANLSLDYRFGPDRRAYLTLSYNRNNNDELRRRLLLDAEAEDARHESLDNRDVTDVPVSRSIREEEKTKDIFSAVLRGEVALEGGFKTGASLNYSYAGSKMPYRLDADFTYPYNIFFDVSNPDVPEYFPFDITQYQNSAINHLRFGTPITTVYDTAFDDMNHLTNGGLEIISSHAQEHFLTGKADLEKTGVGLGAELSGKIGLKGGLHVKDQTMTGQTDTVPGVDDPRLSDYLSSYSESDFFNGHYTLNNMPDIGQLSAYYNAETNTYPPNTGGDIHLEVDPQNFHAQDYNAAGYAQGKYHRGAATVVGGVRVEYTALHYDGFVTVTDGSLQNHWYRTDPLSMDKHFYFVLPMILGRYALTPEASLRASYTHSFARPDWYDLVPHGLVQNDDGIITVNTGNPDLKPPKAHNVDFSIEDYTGGENLMTAGLFYKRIDDYIVSTDVTTYPNGGKTQWLYYEDINGDHADLAGAEFAFRQAPRFLYGFGVDLNYTYTWSNTRIPGETHTSPLPKQSAHTGNFALFYDHAGFIARVGCNVRSHFIDEIATYENRNNESYPDLNVYVDDHVQVDASVSVHLDRHASWILEANNLTNEPYTLYLSNRDHVTQEEYYSWSAQTGFKMLF